MVSLFTKIIKEEIPCHKIMEDENYLAFLDVRPINPGHTLVIPKKEVDYFFDLDDVLLGGLLVFAKKVVKKIEPHLDCERIGIMVAGLEVPHAHVHLVPMKDLGDLNFSKAKPANPEELTGMAEKLKSVETA